jgi:hypothetical protein
MGSRVLLPFLVAAKSLQASLGTGRFVVLDDGTLSARERETIAYHLGGCEFRSRANVHTAPCPSGGCWERLLTILDLRAENYVIQFDSDTVTRGPLPEVAEAITANRSFTLRGEASAELLSVDAFTRVRLGTDYPGKIHVQDAVEAVVEQVRIPGLSEPRYVRGCAGFAGFAPSQGGRGMAEAFATQMERLIGPERWREWGTEQVMSNFIVANEFDPLILPYDRYFNFEDDGVPPDSRFLHFYGTWRFSGGAYLAETRAAISRLRGLRSGVDSTVSASPAPVTRQAVRHRDLPLATLGGR